MIKTSIVIPVYNRAWCIDRAFSSALSFSGRSNVIEIIFVDDGSSDNTLALVKNLILEHCHLANIIFQVHTFEKNLGVCAAKNFGAFMARGEWIIFFDSDDELMPEGIERLIPCLSSGGADMHFFSAIAENSEFDVNQHDLTVHRTFYEYLKYGIGGEALPVIKRELFQKFPYDEDIRGYESLAYMRMVKYSGRLIVHSLGLRRYYVTHTDRLSTKENMRKRRIDLMTGHLRALKEHIFHAPIIWSIKQMARYLGSYVKYR